MITSYKTHHKLSTYRDWFQTEAQKHPQNRNKRIGHVDFKNYIYQRYYERMLRELLMATKKKPNKVTWKGYINISIPSERMAEAENYGADDKVVFMAYNTILRDGYTVKFAHDSEKDTVRATLYCNNPDDENAGYATGGWGG